MPDDREQVIRERAYEIWEQQGCPVRHSLDHWLQANSEIANDEALGIRHQGKLEPPPPRGPQTIKDVLVFLDDGEAANSCLRIAADLARKHRAYLTAVYLPSEAVSVSGQTYGPGAIGIGVAGLALARVGEGSGVDPNPDRTQGQPEHVGAEIAERRFRQMLQLNSVAGELIANAETVNVISVASREGGIERQHPSLARIVRHLERHGLPAAGTDDVQTGIRVSDVLLSRANDLAADLIVAGAYHHSRFREAILGGVSRELFDHMTVPILMSH